VPEPYFFGRWAARQFAQSHLVIVHQFTDRLADERSGTWEFAMRLFAAFIRDENGATAVEYGLVVAGIALAVAAALPSLSTKMSNVFSSLSTSMK
jgi:pilus assembly protein Flp/PilA